MNNLQINIDSQRALLGIDIKEPEFKIEQGKAELQLEKRKDKIEIEQQAPEIRVDNYPSFHDRNMKNIQDFLEENIVNPGRKEVQKGRIRYARQGDRMMEIHQQDVSIISQLAKENAFDKQRDIQLKWVDRPVVEAENIHYLQIKSAGPGKDILDIKVKTQKLRAFLEWGKVIIKLKQKPGIDITVRGNNVNRKA